MKTKDRSTVKFLGLVLILPILTQINVVPRAGGTCHIYKRAN